MSRFKTSTMDADLQKVFGNPVPELHVAAAGPDASPRSPVPWSRAPSWL
jgi:hypothetical protein